MKTKLYKIFGVALALVLVFSLGVGFMPATKVEAQAYTPNQWNAMSIPSGGGLGLVGAGSNITDFAVAADGTTIYVVDGGLNALYKSTNGGWSFSPLTIPAVVGTLSVIAVAPDNPDAAAYVDDAGGAADIVYITSNGGSTWAALVAPAAAAETISDIAVSPARTGTILNRDYAVCTLDPLTGVFGDVYVVGQTATWATYAVVTALGLDFTSVALAPNWTGDRVVLAVGSDNANAGNPTPLLSTVGDSYFVGVNVATAALCAPGPVLLDAGTCDSPAEQTFAAGPGEALSSSIALPADFDSTSVGGYRAYVGWTSRGNTCGDDVYRVDFNSARKLEIRPLVGIYSVSYFGTIGAGTLMAGTTAAIDGGVWFSSDPTSGMPSWGAGSAKPPTGLTNYIVALTSNTEAFAGTSGDDSGFHKTLDGGLSFNGLSLIEYVATAIANISDVMPSPDGSVVFMATYDALGPDGVAVTGDESHSLWRGNGFPAPGGWQRVHFRTIAQFTGPSSLIRVSPHYLTDSTLYWFDYDPAGAVASLNIRRSTDAGQMWGGRTAPAMVMDAAIESQNVLYTINGASVYASTNGAWFFELPSAPGIGPLYSIAMAPSYPNAPVDDNVLVGAVGAGVCLSTNASATAPSWRPLLSFIGLATNVVVCGDAGYAENKIAYAASNTAGQGIWRYNIDSSSAWENIRGVAGQMTGLAQHGGVLFGSWAGVAAGAVGADSFTITGPARGETATITVTVGSVLATPAATATVGGVAGAVPITPGMGAVALTFPAAGDSILFTATAAGTSGTWAITAGAPAAAITTDVDGDAAVAAAGGVFTLPDAVAGAAAAASGAERTLLPTVPAYAAFFWDTMDIGSAAATFNATPSALRIAGTDTTTSAWAINTTVGANALMAYNDEMALAKAELTVPDTVPFDSVTGGSAEFTISWTNISNATLWELEICTDPGMAQRVIHEENYLPPFPPAPTFVVAVNRLVAGKDYFAHVMATDEAPRDAIRSQWSSVQRFSVTAGERVEVSYLGVQPLGPVPGATDVPLSPGFTWSPYADSTRYEFQLASDAGFSDILAEDKVAVTGYKYDGTLANATTYFWRARGIEPTVTDWSPVSSFTTEKKPVPPVVVEPTPLPEPAAPSALTPAVIWAIIAIGAILVIAVIVLIVRTKRAV